ncbi:DUF58 domain-containing protein [uncultured Massilia sp.]|uniref:DUF58 domain-containing protein n=1 Tax=uncultured Massilia sp. TaxID=169973 RepID=UPI0025DE62A7|nr:DUF58 domain-containing protein [uncultured Massilia sp.]
MKDTAATAADGLRGPDGWLARRRRRLRDAWRTRATAHDRGDVVLGQRRVYIVPTRAGLGFGLLVLVLLVGSINYSLGLGFGLTFLAGACAIVDMVATWRNLAGLTLRPGRAPDAFAGAEAQFALHVANTSALERYAIQIDVDGAGAARHALDVAAGDGATVVLAVPARARGWLAAPRVRVATRFPLGLFRAWSWWQPDSRALVYPAPEIDAPPLPSSGRPGPDGGGQAGSDDFAGVRSYQAGDPLRRLAWRQIARLDPALGGQLVTKQFEGGSVDELLLDFDALPPRLDLELRLSRMARWVLEAELRALPYALRLGPLEYDAALGAAHQAACLRALALYGHPEAP